MENKMMIKPSDETDAKLLERKAKMIEAALEEFREKGLKFTMDDIAKRLGMSKKTIYKVFQDKETLFGEAVDSCYALIKEREKEIMQDTSLDDLEKLKKVLIAFPDQFRDIDWRQIAALSTMYPEIFEKLTNHINTEWEPTLALIEHLMETGRIRRISVPIFRLMVETSIESFIRNPVLLANHITFEEALEYMVDILVDGIKCK